MDIRVRGARKPVVRGALAVLALIVGGIIYILFRTNTLLMFTWFDSCGLGPAIRTAREAARPFQSALPGWIRYTLPGGLWLYSMLEVVALIWLEYPKVSISLGAIPRSLLRVGSEESSF